MVERSNWSLALTIEKAEIVLTHGIRDDLVVVPDRITIDGLDKWPGGRFILEIVKDELKQNVVWVAFRLADTTTWSA